MKLLRNLLRIPRNETRRISRTFGTPGSGEPNESSSRGAAEGKELRDPREGTEFRGAPEGTELRNPAEGTQIRLSAPGSQVKDNTPGSQVRETTFMAFFVLYFIEMVIFTSLNLWLGNSGECSNNDDIEKWCGATGYAGLASVISLILTLVCISTSGGLGLLGILAWFIASVIHLGISCHAMNLAVQEQNDGFCRDRIIVFLIATGSINVSIFTIFIFLICFAACLSKDDDDDD